MEWATVDGNREVSGKGCHQINSLPTEVICPVKGKEDKRILAHDFYEKKQHISLSKERRAVQTMAIIMGVFVICWLPFFLVYVIFAFCEPCAQTDKRVSNTFTWLGYMNSALNPVIYTIFNFDFQRAFKRLLQGQCKRIRWCIFPCLSARLQYLQC